MSFRPTLIERAYQLAESGTCATPKEVKQRLFEEGFATITIQVQLHGGTIAAALLRRCRANYKGRMDDVSEVLCQTNGDEDGPVRPFGHAHS